MIFHLISIHPLQRLRILVRLLILVTGRCANGTFLDIKGYGNQAAAIVLAIDLVALLYTL